MLLFATMLIRLAYLVVFFIGSHIGPEPTTDRFIVVMVSMHIGRCNFEIVFIGNLKPV